MRTSQVRRLGPPQAPRYKPKPPSCGGCPWATKSVGYAAGNGDPTANLWVIAESLGENEAIQGIPLVGWSGHELNHDLRASGTARSAVYCDNVVRCKPPQGAKKNVEKVPQAVVDYCTTQYLGQLLHLHRPHAILALGELSLRYLTGRRKITRQRGSLLVGPHGTPVVPTVHYSATVAREGVPSKLQTLRPFIRFDVGKAVEVSRRAAPPAPPVHNFNINPSLRDIEDAFASIRAAGGCAVDIEHAGGPYWSALPLCVGFYWPAPSAPSAPAEGRGLCVPLFGYRGADIWTPDELSKVIALLGDLLSDPSTSKVFQNGNSDIMHLESIGL